MAGTQRVLTTGEVAKYCQVTPMTVLNWINSDQLKAYQTPGGHYRVQHDDFKDFLKRHGMPIRMDLFPEERKKILVVDDEPQVVDFILRVLRGRFPDFEFDTAFNGYDAGFQAAVLRPDLVILDIRMPGIDGFEVCRRIKTSQETMSARVLAITAFPEDQSVERIMASGADDYLIKPFDAKELISKILSLT